MTQDEARRLVKKHGSVLNAAKAVGMAKSTFHDRLKGKGTIISANVPEKTSDSARGISLASARVSIDKPTETFKRLFFSLKRNMAYPIDDLARAWCRSADSIRKNAREHKCLLYVETSPGNWQTCALHPDAATEYHKKAGEI